MSIIKKQSILNTVFSYMGVVIGTLTQGFLIPNFFTTEQNGLMALLMGWMFIFCQFASLGFNSAGVKYFSFFRNPAGGHNGFLSNGLIINLTGFVLATLLFIGLKDILISGGGNSILEKNANAGLFNKYYYYILPIAFATLLFNLFDNYAKNLYDTVWGSFLSQFLQRFLILLAILLVVFTWVEFDEFIYYWVAAISIPSIFMIYRSYKLGNFSLKFNPLFFQSAFKKQFFNFALFSVITGLSTIIISQLDKIMVYKLLGLSETGIYNTCLLFGSVIGMSYLAVIKASSAIVVDAIDKQEYYRIEAIYKKSSIFLFTFGFSILIIVWVNIDNIFSFIKPEYALGKTALILVGIGKLFDLINSINGLILSNSKYYKIDSAIIISFVLVLYLFNELLIPAYGLTGAAIATILAIVYYNGLRTFLVWKFFGIHPFGFEQVKILLIGVIVLLISLQIPVMHGNVFLRLADVCLKSGVILAVFAGLLIYLKVSKDLNESFDSGWVSVKKFLGK
jgi:O-antigen/teichoic acid export membrane protein